MATRKKKRKKERNKGKKKKERRSRKKSNCHCFAVNNRLRRCDAALRFPTRLCLSLRRRYMQFCCKFWCSFFLCTSVPLALLRSIGRETRNENESKETHCDYKSNRDVFFQALLLIRWFPKWRFGMKCAKFERCSRWKCDRIKSKCFRSHFFITFGNGIDHF